MEHIKRIKNKVTAYLIKWTSQEPKYPFSWEFLIAAMFLLKGLEWGIIFAGLFFVGMATSVPIPHETLMNISTVMSNKLISPLETMVAVGQKVGDHFGDWRLMIAGYGSIFISYIPWLIITILVFRPIKYYVWKLYWYIRRDRFHNKVEVYK